MTLDFPWRSGVHMGIRIITNAYRCDSVKNSAYLDQYDWGGREDRKPFHGPKKPMLCVQDAHVNEDGTIAATDPHFYTKSDETIAVGCVVAVEHRSERIMSDVWDTCVYAVYYDVQSGGFREKHLYTAGDAPRVECKKTATVDATDDIKEAYKVWKMGNQLRQDMVWYDKREEEAAYERKRPGRGKWVEVYKGRKVKKGTKGYVFWEGVDNWGNVKVGIAVSERKDSRGRFADVEWTAMSNVRLIQEAQFQVN